MEENGDREIKTAETEVEEKKLEGLGGWLILIGIGIVISPVFIIATTFPGYYEIFTGGSWSVLTSPGTVFYNPLWAPVLIGELFVNIALALAWVFAGYLFFTKRIMFPRFYMGLLIFSLVFVVSDAFVVKLVLPDASVADPETIKEIARSVAAVCIWVPYMIVSKRVKSTFVK